MFKETLSPENIIKKYRGYSLVYMPETKVSKYPDKHCLGIFDPQNEFVWQFFVDFNPLDLDRDNSDSIDRFKDEVDDDIAAMSKIDSHYLDTLDDENEFDLEGSYDDLDYDEFEVDNLWSTYNDDPKAFSDNSTSSIKPYMYTAPARKTGYLDTCNKSNTLVFHCDDSSTVMLKQIYEGKGWDVISDTYIDKDEIHELMKSHDRIICLGHGSSYGLMGGNIGPEEAPYFEGKKIFVIWCNADKYFKNHGIGEGFFITKNAPSEVGESIAAGCGNISRELMLENITYWCKLCGDVVEEALEGDRKSAVNYIRKNYLEKYGNHPVTIYNADSASLLGIDMPLPEYTFKGDPLQPKDYPYPGFNEDEFLKNPKPRIR